MMRNEFASFQKELYSRDWNAFCGITPSLLHFQFFNKWKLELLNEGKQVDVTFEDYMLFQRELTRVDWGKLGGSIPTFDDYTAYRRYEGSAAFYHFRSLFSRKPSFEQYVRYKQHKTRFDWDEVGCRPPTFDDYINFQIELEKEPFDWKKTIGRVPRLEEYMMYAEAVKELDEDTKRQEQFSFRSIIMHGADEPQQSGSEPEKRRRRSRSPSYSRRRSRSRSRDRRSRSWDRSSRSPDQNSRSRRERSRSSERWISSFHRRSRSRERSYRSGSRDESSRSRDRYGNDWESADRARKRRNRESSPSTSSYTKRYRSRSPELSSRSSMEYSSRSSVEHRIESRDTVQRVTQIQVTHTQTSIGSTSETAGISQGFPSNTETHGQYSHTLGAAVTQHKAPSYGNRPTFHSTYPPRFSTPARGYCQANISTSYSAFYNTPQSYSAFGAAQTRQNVPSFSQTQYALNTPCSGYYSTNIGSNYRQEFSGTLSAYGQYLNTTVSAPNQTAQSLNTETFGQSSATYYPANLTSNLYQGSSRTTSDTPFLNKFKASSPLHNVQSTTTHNVQSKFSSPTVGYYSRTAETSYRRLSEAISSARASQTGDAIAVESAETSAEASQTSVEPAHTSAGASQTSAEASQTSAEPAQTPVTKTTENCAVTMTTSASGASDPTQTLGNVSTTSETLLPLYTASQTTGENLSDQDGSVIFVNTPPAEEKIEPIEISSADSSSENSDLDTSDLVQDVTASSGIQTSLDGDLLHDVKPTQTQYKSRLFRNVEIKEERKECKFADCGYTFVNESGYNKHVADVHLPGFLYPTSRRRAAVNPKRGSRLSLFLRILTFVSCRVKGNDLKIFNELVSYMRVHRIHQCRENCTVDPIHRHMMEKYHKSMGGSSHCINVHQPSCFAAMLWWRNVHDLIVSLPAHTQRVFYGKLRQSSMIVQHNQTPIQASHPNVQITPAVIPGSKIKRRSNPSACDRRRKKRTERELEEYYGEIPESIERGSGPLDFTVRQRCRFPGCGYSFIGEFAYWSHLADKHISELLFPVATTPMNNARFTTLVIVLDRLARSVGILVRKRGKIRQTSDFKRLVDHMKTKRTHVCQPTCHVDEIHMQMIRDFHAYMQDPLPVQQINVHEPNCIAALLWWRTVHDFILNLPLIKQCRLAKKFTKNKGKPAAYTKITVPSDVSDESESDDVDDDSEREDIATNQQDDFAQEQSDFLKQEHVPEETEGVPEETEGVPEDTEVVPEKTEGVSEKTEDVLEETEGVPEKTEGVSEETEDVLEETESIPEETEDVPEETEDVSEQQEGVTKQNDLTERFDVTEAECDDRFHVQCEFTGCAKVFTNEWEFYDHLSAKHLPPLVFPNVTFDVKGKVKAMYAEFLHSLLKVTGLQSNKFKAGKDKFKRSKQLVTYMQMHRIHRCSTPCTINDVQMDLVENYHIASKHPMPAHEINVHKPNCVAALLWWKNLYQLALVLPWNEQQELATMYREPIPCLKRKLGACGNKTPRTKDIKWRGADNDESVSAGTTMQDTEEIQCRFVSCDYEYQCESEYWLHLAHVHFNGFDFTYLRMDETRVEAIKRFLGYLAQMCGIEAKAGNNSYSEEQLQNLVKFMREYRIHTCDEPCTVNVLHWRLITEFHQLTPEKPQKLKVNEINVHEPNCVAALLWWRNIHDLVLFLPQYKQEEIARNCPNSLPPQSDQSGTKPQESTPQPQAIKIKSETEERDSD